MFESTSIIIYTLFYLIVSTCFVLRTAEFVSNGLTVENLFGMFIEKEYDNFVMHHIKRTTFSIALHCCLPILYLYLSQLVDNSEKAFLNVYFKELYSVALLPVVYGVLVVTSWMSNDWAHHPLSVTLSRYGFANWAAVAQSISTEYKGFNKLTLAYGTLNRTVITENWIISIKPYSIYAAKKAESSFLVYSSDDHKTTPNGGPGGVQFINIEVLPIRAQIAWFHIRIKTEDLKILEENIGHSIQIADNVKLQRSRSERFIEVFRDQVSQNPVYNGYTAAELEDNLCAGCLVNPPDVKLMKCCEDSTDTNVLKCTLCQCRPMWCVDCMAKWYESRQPQNDTSIWLSSKCTCPLCRQVFCILDVCPLENSALASAK